MKKTLIFAAASATALVNTILNVSSANATDLYGSYNPICEQRATTLKFWGYKQDGTFGNIGSVDYLNGTYNGFGTVFSDLDNPIAKGLKLRMGSETHTFTNGIVPRAVIFYSAGDSNAAKPQDTIYATTDNQTNDESYMVTKTSCNLNNVTLNDLKDSAGEVILTAEQLKKLMLIYSCSTTDGTTSCTAPTAPSKNSDFSNIIDNIILNTNPSEINFIVAYAAACVPSQYATCSVTIKSNGAVQYWNSCVGGCNPATDGFGRNTVMCYVPSMFNVTPVQNVQSKQVAM